MSHWTEEKRKRFDELSDYVKHVESKYEKALEELREISMGIVYAGLPDTWSHSLKLQNRASKVLKELATTSYKRPNLWW